MAGEGKRTRNNQDIPKPLMVVNDRPLFSWAMKGLPLELASDLTIVTNQIVGNHPHFSSLLASFAPKNLTLNVKTLHQKTTGQAETVKIGSEDIPNTNAILIFNCDTIISDDFPRDYSRWDGILGTFPSTNPSLSYVEVRGQKVLRTAEKDVISSQASTGLYYFRSKELFLEAFDQTPLLTESYVAPLYNYLIQRDLKVTSFETKEFIPLGTLEEIESFRL